MRISAVVQEEYIICTGLGYYHISRKTRHACVLFVGWNIRGPIRSGIGTRGSIIVLYRMDEKGIDVIP